MKALLPILLLLCASDFPEGVRAFREGRFGDALEAFTEAEKALGDRASAALLHNKALAALRAGKLTDAEASAERAAAAGGPELLPFRDFLHGNTAFARCEHAELQASQPEAEPFAYDLAIAYREMGLLDDAISEFQVATRCPKYEVLGHLMIGLCYTDLRRHTEAVESYKTALSSDHITLRERIAVLSSWGWRTRPSKISRRPWSATWR